MSATKRSIIMRTHRDFKAFAEAQAKKSQKTVVDITKEFAQILKGKKIKETITIDFM